MASKPRTLELTNLSAEGIRVRGKPATKNIFMLVRAESQTTHTTSTAEAANCGIHRWSEKFEVELGAHARSLTFEVKCKIGTAARDVGVARIALSDFLGGLVPDHCLQFLCYRLRDCDGRQNGIVNFSVRVAAPPPPPLPPPPPVAFDGENEMSMGVVVTGIPVWWNKSTCGTSNV